MIHDVLCCVLESRQAKVVPNFSVRAIADISTSRPILMSDDMANKYDIIQPTTEQLAALNAHNAIYRYGLYNKIGRIVSTKCSIDQ